MAGADRCSVADRDHGVVVRVMASGVCHSDLHFVDGFYEFPAPAILGHEAAGIVEEVGPLVDDFNPGDHVIACLSVFCGRCDYCLTGRTNLCSTRPIRAKNAPRRLRWQDQPVNQFANLSAYAEKMLVHSNAIVKVRDDMPLDRAALIGCGVSTGVGAALNTARVEPGSMVAVFGCGGVGLSAIQGARIAGARMMSPSQRLQLHLHDVDGFVQRVLHHRTEVWAPVIVARLQLAQVTETVCVLFWLAMNWRSMALGMASLLALGHLGVLALRRGLPRARPAASRLH